MPTGIVAVTVLVAVLITETVLGPAATYVPPAGICAGA